MRLLSLSEALIQPRTSLVKFAPLSEYKLLLHILHIPQVSKARLSDDPDMVDGYVQELPFWKESLSKAREAGLL